MPQDETTMTDFVDASKVDRASNSQTSLLASVGGTKSARATSLAKVTGLLSDASNKKTLILCPIGLGNFIMATPSLKVLSEHVGLENLEILSLKPGISQMATSCGLFGRVYTLYPDRSSLAALLQCLMKLRRRNFGFVISLFPTSNWRYCLVERLVGAKHRVGFDYFSSNLPGLTHTHTVTPDLLAHDTDQNYALAASLVGALPENRYDLIFPYAALHPQADELSREPYYVCHPGSSTERGMSEKRLSPARFSQMINLIHREFGLKCVLIGGQEEAALRQAITEAAPGCCLPYGSRSFPELAGLISPARFYLGNDSGLMHIAAALNKPCIAFFGPTDDRRNGPYQRQAGSDEHRHFIVRADLPCSPCWSIATVGANPPCVFGDTRCLSNLDVLAEWPKIREFLRGLPELGDHVLYALPVLP